MMLMASPKVLRDLPFFLLLLSFPLLFPVVELL